MAGSIFVTGILEYFLASIYQQISGKVKTNTYHCQLCVRCPIRWRRIMVKIVKPWVETVDLIYKISEKEDNPLSYTQIFEMFSIPFDFHPGSFGWMFRFPEFNNFRVFWNIYMKFPYHLRPFWKRNFCVNRKHPKEIFLLNNSKFGMLNLKETSL